MKYLYLLLVIVTGLNFGFSQEDVEVFEKEEGNSTMLVGKNNLDEAVEITLKLTYSGFVTKDTFPLKKVLKAKEEITLVTLNKPPQTECEYSTSVSYKKVANAGKRINRTTGIQINTTKINVFTRDDCARCKFVIDEFEKNKVVYLELNTTLAPSNKELMFEKLKEVGFKGNTVQMPVVVYNGEVFYNITDLQAFVKKYKK
ncbi:MAG: hypothetical protein IPL63_09980 [Saprospiraceae bacterium]|nr:hypothetical protein [Saprospiraceae bacterium]MBK6563968.1 hypothetical protein [Saprospiraceae bacterium]MBK7524631.1 hypothetical protein [Saprospiraceae bacterium]MBK8373045.1 hypothetical protein [Saprospiraceae bacterium]MBK8547687.1 hypothetical protein [Saprospiraceae bacterium]